jgi:hypothetical protein
MMEGYGSVQIMIDPNPRGPKTYGSWSRSTTLAVITVLFRSSRYEDYRGPPPSSGSRDSRGPPPPRYRSRSPIGRGPSPPRSAFLPPPAPIVFFLFIIFSDKDKNLCLWEIEFYSRCQMLSNIKESEFKYWTWTVILRFSNTEYHNIPADIPVEIFHVCPAWSGRRSQSPDQYQLVETAFSRAFIQFSRSSCYQTLHRSTVDS